MLRRYIRSIRRRIAIASPSTSAFMARSFIIIGIRAFAAMMMMMMPSSLGRGIAPRRVVVDLIIGIVVGEVGICGCRRCGI